MKKVLILGASGFIGQNLIQYFCKKKDYKIIGVYNNSKPRKLAKVNFIKADLRKRDEASRVVQNCDIIIQAAAITSGSNDIVKRPHIHVTDNLIINSNILDACHKNKIKHFIFFSCTIMYHSSLKKLKETDFDPQKKISNKYFASANTKLSIEKLCEFFSRISDCKFTAIRHSNIYGPNDKFDLKKSHVFGATVRKVFSSKKKITVWGNGKEKRDLLYIDDLINFVEKVIKKQKSKFEIFNCGYGKSISINNLVNLIMKISKKKLKIYYDKNKPTIPTNILIDCTKARKKLGWKKKISLEEGIKRTLSWVEENLNF